MNYAKRLVVLLIVALAVETAALGEVTDGIRGEYPSGRKGRICDAPGAHFYPDYQPKEYPPYGQLAPAPAYAWGYFGARSRPFSANHRGYYRDHSLTIFPRTF